MDKLKILNSLKSGHRYYLNKLLIEGGDFNFDGTGHLKYSNQRFCVELYLPQNENPPKFKLGQKTINDAWKLSGEIEHKTPFRVEHLPPYADKNEYIDKTRHLHELQFEFSKIDFTPSSFIKCAKQIEKKSLRKTSDLLIIGHLDGFEILGRNNKTTLTIKNSFFGSTRNDNTDTFLMHLTPKLRLGLRSNGKLTIVKIESKRYFRSKSLDKDKQHFSAAMSALSFVYGRHAWPYALSLYRNNTLAWEYIRALDDIVGSSHQPFPERIWHNVHMGNIKSDLSDNIRRFYSFFMKQTEYSKTIENFLFIFREATDRKTHREVSIIAVCALLENLMRIICKEGIYKKRTTHSLRNSLAIVGVNNVMKKSYRSLKDAKNDVFSKMIHPRNWPAKKVFMFAMYTINYKWDGDGEVIFQLWEANRNSLLHSGRHELDVADKPNHTTVLSRLCGAINLTLAKIVNCKGYIRHSAYEDGYRKI